MTQIITSKMLIILQGQMCLQKVTQYSDWTEKKQTEQFAPMFTVLNVNIKTPMARLKLYLLHVI